MSDLGGIARETEKLLRRIKRLELQLGTGTTRGDADIKDEIGEINQELQDIGWPSLNVSSNKKPKKKDTTKKKETKVASLRSSKDKKFMGHTGRA